MSALGGSRAALRIADASVVGPAPIEPQRPPETPTEPYVEPVGAESPFYSREWRGGPLYVCPSPLADRCFSARSHRAIIRHITEYHDEPEPTVETRARRAGIVLARG